MEYNQSKHGIDNDYLKPCSNHNEENKTFKFEKRHVSATTVPPSVYRWNYNDEQYIAEN